MNGVIFPQMFKDPASYSALKLNMMHDYVMTGVCIIAGLVLAMIVLAQYSQSSFKSSDELVWFEVMWTLGPILLVLYVIFSTVPMSSAYASENFADINHVTIEARQWYWMYNGKASYMLQDGMHRVLDADNVLPIPNHKFTAFSVSSGDVMHSFAVPSLAVKIDALPGRISYDFTYPLTLGTFYGQCSEICGANHSFMPMNVEVIPGKVYFD